MTAQCSEVKRWLLMLQSGSLGQEEAPAASGCQPRSSGGYCCLRLAASVKRRLLLLQAGSLGLAKSNSISQVLLLLEKTKKILAQILFCIGKLLVEDPVYFRADPSNLKKIQ